MASSPSTAGTNSTSSSSSQKDSILEDRKRKRMLSNRESARRSRMRKKKLADDIAGRAANLTAENRSVLKKIDYVARICLDVESENSILRAQVSELKHRLRALNDIVDLMGFNGNISDECYGDFLMSPSRDLMMCGGGNNQQQPMAMASADIFMC